MGFQSDAAVLQLKDECIPSSAFRAWGDKRLIHFKKWLRNVTSLSGIRIGVDRIRVCTFRLPDLCISDIVIASRHALASWRYRESDGQSQFYVSSQPTLSARSISGRGCRDLALRGVQQDGRGAAGEAAWQCEGRGKDAGTGRRESSPAGAGGRRGNRWVGMAFPEDLATENQIESERETTNWNEEVRLRRNASHLLL